MSSTMYVLLGVGILTAGVVLILGGAAVLDKVYKGRVPEGWSVLGFILGLLAAVGSVAVPLHFGLQQNNEEDTNKGLGDMQLIAEALNSAYEDDEAYINDTESLLVEYPQLNEVQYSNNYQITVTDGGDGLLIEYFPDTDEYGPNRDKAYTLTAEDGFVTGRSCRGVDYRCQDGTWDSTSR